jgi:predicted amidophosphoribosyltransferase
MMTWFCLGCFAELDERASHCPACGAETSSCGRAYEEMLIRALSHRLPRTGPVLVRTAIGGPAR